MRVQALASLLKMHKTAKTAPAPTRDCQVQGSEFFESFTTATPALAVHAHLARACVVCVCCRHSACEKEWDRFPVAAGGRPDDLARPTRGTLLAEHKANDKQPGWMAVSGLLLLGGQSSQPKSTRKLGGRSWFEFSRSESLHDHACVGCDGDDLSPRLVAVTACGPMRGTTASSEPSDLRK